MPNTRWVNQGQPQTLFIATIVMYINAVFGLIDGFFLLYSGAGIIFVVGPAVAGFGIANEKKWGYWLGVVVTGLTVLFYLSLLSIGFGVLNLLFSVALLALLLHPMSRGYYKTWFR